MAPTPQQRPLAGKRVLELGDFISVPFAARLLADAGADVLKIEPATGDTARRLGPFAGTPGLDTSAMFAYLNRGKRAIATDLTASASKQQRMRLLGRADVLIHDFAALEHSPLGISQEDLQKAYPGLVVISVTPFGQHGPYASWKADDLVLMAVSGIANCTPGFPDYASDLDAEPPLRSNGYIGEFIGGLSAAVGAMLGLLVKENTGRGCAVDLAKHEALASLMVWFTGVSGYSGNLVGRAQLKARQAPNHYLPCSDGWFVLVAFIDKHWKELVEIMGNPEWASRPEFATGPSRGTHWDELEPLIVSWLVEQRKNELFRKTQERGVPSAPLLSIREAFFNEQSADRGFLQGTGVKGDASGRLPGSAVVLNRERLHNAAPLPPFIKRPAQEVTDHWQEKAPDTRALQPKQGRGRTSASLPFEGIRVLDLGQMIAAPLAGQWMAQLGAEVVLLESRLNPNSRALGPFSGEPPNNSSIFNSVNRGKRSCTVNLRTQEGLALAKQLIASTDVVIENFSAGTLEKIGLGYETLRSIRPDIIVVSMSAFGSTGPWSRYSAFHTGVIASSGLAAITGYRDSHPRLVGSVLPDPVSALFVMLSVSQALFKRRLTGEGSKIDVSMVEAIQSLLPDAIASLSLTGQEPKTIGNWHAHKAPHNMFRADGPDSWVAISIGSQSEWAALCRAMGRPELMNAPRFKTEALRHRNQETLDAIITAWTKPQSRWAIAKHLQSQGVLCGPVFNEHDLISNEHLKARDFAIEDHHPVAGLHFTTGLAWHLSSGRPKTATPAPLLGADNDYVLMSLLGLGSERIEQLTKSQVIH